MKKWWSDAKAGLIYWKLAVTRCCTKMYITGTAALLASVQGLDWKALSTDQKMWLLLGATVAAGGVLDAFLDKTMSQMEGREDTAEETEQQKSDQ